MISVKKAKEILANNVVPLSSILSELKSTTGRVLAEDVFSPVDQPLFNQSAMDGYALNFDPIVSQYKVIGEVAAGKAFQDTLQIGEAVRIFTGAKVPASATTVVPQEHVLREQDIITLMEPTKKGKHIRYRGEQIKKGLLALEKGQIINPAAIGFLASLGITKVQTYKEPTVSIIVTGSELVAPGGVLQEGQIFESNSVMLTSALTEYSFNDYQLYKVPDNLADTITILKEAISKSDLVLLSGGISVGDYDFVSAALKEVGTEELFYKINQKPGKPIYAGKSNETLILALPGNPAAALTCFYQYALPALNVMMGKKYEGLKMTKGVLVKDYEKKGKRAVFLKAKIKNNRLEILEGQSSAMLQTFSEANALAFIPADANSLAKGEALDCYLL